MSQFRKIAWRRCSVVILALLAGPGWSATPEPKAAPARGRPHTIIVAATPPHVGAAGVRALGHLRVAQASRPAVSGLNGAPLPRHAALPASIGGTAAFDARKGGGMISGSIMRHRP